MIASPEELAQLVKLLLKDEGFEIWLKEVVDRRVAEALDKHLDDYKHEETPLTGVEQ